MKRFLFAALMLGVLVTPAIAQQTDQKDKTPHVGITFDLTPSWQFSSAFLNTFGNFETVKIPGKSFEFGIVRGSMDGGEIRASFRRTTFSSASQFVLIRSENEWNGVKRTDTDTYSLRSGALTGFEFGGFKPFVTINHRAQIGLNAGIGFAAFQGSAGKESVRYNGVYDSRGVVNITSTRATTQIDLAQAMKDASSKAATAMRLIYRVQPAVSFTAPTGTKIRVGAGIDYWGFAANVAVTQLLGVHKQPRAIANSNP